MCYPSTLRPRALAACLLALSSFSHAAQPALGFEDALRLAQERSRQLVAQDAASAAAREMAVAAGQRPDPTLKAGINNLPIDGPDQFSLSRDFMTMRSIGLMQELTREDKRKLRSARFEREAEVAQAGRDLALTKLQRNTALAWLDRFFLGRVRSLLVEQRAEAQLQVEAALAAYRGARGAQADIFAARSVVAQIEDRIAQAERQIESATIVLVRWVGEAGRTELGAPPVMDNVRLHAQALDAQLLGHPEIAMMARQEQVAQADANIAQADRRADWSVEFMASQRGPAYSNMVSLNFSLPLQWRREQRQNRELAAKLATVQQMRAEREETTREHLAETQSVLLEWQSNRERLVRYDSTLIPLASERTRAATAAYRGGTGTLKMVLDGRRDEADVRAERLRLEMDTARLWAQLNFLIPAGHLAASPATGGKAP
ncbi:MAG: TolC family protein [Burkholderiales bacterium]